MSQNGLEERYDFRSNFFALFSLPPLERDILTQVLHATDVSALPTLDNSTYNMLIRSLNHPNSQIRRSARAYIFCNLIKDKSYKATNRCNQLLSLNKSGSSEFLEIIKDWHTLDEEDFTLFCQGITELPITTLSYAINFPNLEPVITELLPKLLNSFKELFTPATDYTPSSLSNLNPLARKYLPKLISSLQEVVSLSVQVALQDASDQNSKTLCQIIFSHPKLSQLDLRFRGLANAKVWTQLGETFASMQGLSRLSLTSAFFSSDLGLPEFESMQRAFFQAITKPTNLLSLDLSSNNLTIDKSENHNTWKTFCASVSQLHQLESLILINCSLDNVSSESWQQLKCTHLSTLDLSNNDLGGNLEAWKSLCNMLASLPRLTTLILSNNGLKRLDMEGWQSFFPLAASLQHLSLCNLAPREIQPASMPSENWKLLFHGVQTSNLKSLNLGYNKFFIRELDDESFDLFCQSILDAKYLTKLDLSHGSLDGISKTRFEKFCEMVIEASHLSTLDLWENTFVSEELIPILIKSISKASHITSVAFPNSLQLDAARWQHFWDILNHQDTHLQSLSLRFKITDLASCNAFAKGLSETRTLRSVRFNNESESLDFQYIIEDKLQFLLHLTKYKSNRRDVEPLMNELLERNNYLNQVHVKIKDITKEINANYSSELNLQATQSLLQEFIALLQTLPDHPNTDIYREEAGAIINDLYFAAARWFARNSEPKKATKYYIKISPESPHFQKARGNIFTIVFFHYRNAEKPARQAFIKALRFCVDSQNRLLTLGAEFQRSFDGFLMEAIGLSKSLSHFSDITPLLRLKMFKYLGLLLLQEKFCKVEPKKVPFEFFNKIQIQQGLIDMLERLQPISTFEQLSVLDVDPMWKSVACKHVEAQFSVALKSYSLLSKVITLEENSVQRVETNQNGLT